MRKCSLLLAILLLTVWYAGCGASPSVDKAVFDETCATQTLPSQVVAENDRFSLSWNDEAKCVALTDKTTGKCWSAIPQEYLESGGTSINVTSPLDARVVDINSMQPEMVNGYSAIIENGRMVCEQQNDGLTVTYYLDAYKISIPVQYQLTEQGLTVSIDPAKIAEGMSNYQLLSCSVTPFLCSAANSDDNYLFIPSGSGALMYTYETADDARKFSGELYGVDPARIVQENNETAEALRLPFFGAKDGEDALLGMVDENTGLTFIDAEAGNSSTGYSTVYPTFYFRSYDVVKQRSTANGLGGGSDVMRTADDLSVGVASVSYYPLHGDAADYNGMAKKARSLLNVEKSDAADNAAMYSVTVLGGVKTTSSILGIPKQTVKAMTTFAQTQTMLEELKKQTGAAPSVRLQGFGNGGINPGSVAGGYKFLSLFGSKDELEDYCKQQSIPLFTDFDVVCYGKSGNGFGYNSAAAKTALHKQAEQYVLNMPLRDLNTDEPFRILGRTALTKAVDKLLKKAPSLDVSAISLSTLGNTAYSDYSLPESYAKAHMAADVQALLKKVKAADYPLAVSGGNSYAAAIADTIFDVPTDKGQDKALDVRIPFYSMVYGGSKALYSEPVNMAANQEQAAALAMSGGVGLGYTLIQEYDVSYAETGVGKLYATVYASNREAMANTIEKYAACYEAIGGATIQRYELLENGVTRTVYDNGASILVNGQNKEVKTTVGDFAPYECKLERKAGQI